MPHGRNISIKAYLLLVTSLIAFIACDRKVAEAKDVDKKSYSENYLNQIVSYIDFWGKKDNVVESVYKNFTAIPKKVFLIQHKQERIRIFEIGKNIGCLLKYNEREKNDFSFPCLGYVFKTGDMWFTGVEEKERLLGSSLYIKESGEIKKYNDYWAEFPSPYFKVFLNGQWDILHISADGTYAWVGEEGSKIIIDIPVIPHCGSSLCGSINSGLGIFYSEPRCKYMDGNRGGSLLFQVYDIEKREVVKKILLPGTDHYRTMQLVGAYDGECLDSQNRIYCCLYPYKGAFYKHGNILIYDILNDILYTFDHPFFDEENKEEEVIGGSFVLGEDENIYYQLATDKRYYIYKITPDWDGPREEIEYNPVFYYFNKG